MYKTTNVISYKSRELIMIGSWCQLSKVELDLQDF